MAKIVLVFLVACALVMLGFLMGVLFARSDSDVYDYDDLMRAYSSGFNSGYEAGGCVLGGKAERSNKLRSSDGKAMTVTRLKEVLNLLPEDLVDAPVLMLRHPVTEVRYRCSDDETVVHICSDSLIAL